jgi:hypothetical protein
MGIIVLAVIVLLIAAPIVALRRWLGRRRRQPGSIRWRGYVSFQETSLSDPDLFPQIERRRALGGVGRKGLSGGICEMDHHGLSWTSRPWFTPQARINGSFRLPWSVIVSGGAYRLPFRIPGLGGAVSLVLADSRGTLDGEFIGSIEELNNAIQAGIGVEAPSS